MEIERKFLVNKNYWDKISKPIGDKIIQGYLLKDKNKTIRIRVLQDKAYITLKGETKNISREEYEFPIPVGAAYDILKKFCKETVEKTRYKIIYKGKIWEVDEFHGENDGLILAEIELNNEKEIFELPEWIEEEVTHDPRYYNSNLASNPYKQW